MLRYNLILCCQLLALAAWVPAVHASIVDFNFTGSEQQFVVPVNVHIVTLRVSGAQGQANAGGVAGGFGGYATGNLAVTPGDLLYIYVGGGGTLSTLGGWNGGGNAGTGSAAARGGGGGGASDVRLFGNGVANRVIVGAGGGGAGGNRIENQGRGTGGGGGAGWYGGGGGAGWPYTSTTLPTGGNQVSGGIGGDSSWTGVPGNDGNAGSFGTGGNGGKEVFSLQAGGAIALPGGVGGGLIGGSGQYGFNWTGQSGAGGSSYLGSLSNAQTLAGTQQGNGFVELEFTPIINAVPEPTMFLSWTLLATLAAGGRFLKQRRNK